jgi:hypothetical protein
MRKVLKKQTPRNLVAKDLYTPKYRMRVVSNKKKSLKNKHKIKGLDNPMNW